MEQSEKNKRVEEALVKISKQFGKTAVMKLSDKPEINVEAISTGSLGLDIALGIGGLPKGRVVEIYGPESSGKCVTPDSYIFTSEGYEQVADIFAQHQLSMDCVTKEVPVSHPLINGRGEVENTTHFTFNGRKPIYEIVTKSGFVHKATAKHPLMVLSETGQFVWKWSSEIEVGDKLVNRPCSYFGKKSHDIDTMYAVGLMLADGSFSNPITIFNNDPDICNFITQKLCVALEGISLIVSEERGNTTGYRLNVGSKKEWYEKWGFVEGVAKDKKIPKWVFGSNKESLSALIRGFVDAESHISKAGIEIVSASYEMLYQFKILLSQFQIESNLLKQGWDMKGYEENDYWRLNIYGEDVERYYYQIGTDSKLREKQLQTFFSNKTYYNDGIPNIKQTVLDFCKTLTRSQECQRLITDLNSKNIDVTRTKLKLILEYADRDIDKSIDNSITYSWLRTVLDHTFDEVVSVEKREGVPTFDFAMERTHTFIADGCINHNTTLTIHIMAEAQKLGGNVGFIDAEMAFDPTYATNLGVDLEKLYFAQPSCGEEALEIAAGLIESGGFDVIVIDSVAALVPKAELDGEMGDAKMGLQARMMSQAMRKITASVSKSNTLVIFINQLREKIGVMFGSPEVTTGGNALKFYASVRLDVRRSSQLKDGDEIMGNLTKVKVVKNKVAPPFKVAEFDIMYGRGISKAGEIVDLGVEAGVIKKAGSWYSYGETKLGQGRDGVKQLLEDNPELMDELEVLIKQQIS